MFFAKVIWQTARKTGAFSSYFLFCWVWFLSHLAMEGSIAVLQLVGLAHQASYLLLNGCHLRLPQSAHRLAGLHALMCLRQSCLQCHDLLADNTVQVHLPESLSIQHHPDSLYRMELYNYLPTLPFQLMWYMLDDAADMFLITTTKKDALSLTLDIYHLWNSLPAAVLPLFFDLNSLKREVSRSG